MLKSSVIEQCHRGNVKEMLSNNVVELWSNVVEHCRGAVYLSCAGSCVVELGRGAASLSCVVELRR